MTDFARTRLPPAAVGLTSVILSSVGLLLFLMPILSIPLSVLGLLFGLVGAAMAIIGGWASLRWSVAGIVLSGLVLVLSVAIAQTAAGYLSNASLSATELTIPDRPYVPPPAQPGKFPP